jgi:acyl-CoA synthetase (AMP-forming)/AMP-acid ligase II
VSPAELEALILTLPGVSDCAVIGVPLPRKEGQKDGDGPGCDQGEDEESWNRVPGLQGAQGSARFEVPKAFVVRQRAPGDRSKLTASKEGAALTEASVKAFVAAKVTKEQPPPPPPPLTQHPISKGARPVHDRATA